MPGISLTYNVKYYVQEWRMYI